MKRHRHNDQLLYTYGMTKFCLSLLIVFLASCSTEPPTVVPPSDEHIRTDSEIAPETLKKESFPHTQPARQLEWMRAVERGEEAAKDKRWEKAADFYNRALDLIDDPIATPQAPSHEQIKKVLRRASEAQLLAENSRKQGTRSILSCSAMMRRKVRGLQIVRHLIPVQFKFGKTTFSEKGQESASRLAYCLQHTQYLNKVKLVGHTDGKGSEAFNSELSIARANALKTYLQNEGVNIHISTEGKGKKEPLALDNHNNYTSKEIDALNRRVEVITQ